MPWLVWFERIVVALANLLGIAQIIRDLAGGAAKEHSDFAVETAAVNAELALMNPWHGLEAIKTVVDAIASDMADIQNAVDGVSVQVANLPVPPTGGENASAVWSYFIIPDVESAGQMLAWLERYAELTSAYGSWPWEADPMFAISGSFKYPPD